MCRGYVGRWAARQLWPWIKLRIHGIMDIYSFVHHIILKKWGRLKLTEPVGLGHPPPSPKMVYIGPAKCLWVVKTINSKSTLAQCKML